MSRQIVRLDDPRHFDELMAVLDTAFNREPGTFVRMLPGRYRPTVEHVGQHYAVREGGGIVAALGVYPIQWHVGDRVLDVAGIGAVSTHPDWRGRGLMSELLRHVAAEVRRRGFHLSWLGGQRQRYRHYGWERGGIKLNVDLTAANLRHERGMRSLPEVSLAPLTEAGDDEIAQLHRWHDAQPIHCVRPSADFAVVLSHWHRQPMIARDKHGSPIGYAVLDGEGTTIGELVGRDDTAARAIVRAVLERGEAPRATLIRPALSCPLNRWLLAISETATCTVMGNWQVIDWPTVIEALLAARCAHESTVEGTVTLRIEGVEKSSLCLSVQDGQAVAAWTDERPDLSVDAVTLTRLLLGPVKPSQVTDLPSGARILDAWCPLPAAIPHQDKV